MYNNQRRALAAVAFAVTLSAAGIARATDAPDFVTLVKENAAAVVNINTSQAIKSARDHSEPGTAPPTLPENTPFNEFFKRFFEGQPGAPLQRQTHSLGSGFIISNDGYILTNAHVVKEADKINVQLSDRRDKAAQLVGLDERTDIALLKVDANDLPVVKIGESSALQVGEWVLAIGSPFGLEHTATQGIVSALGRSLPSDTYVPFIQTDVAVNPGNSGGPLFNTRGEVIGVNSQIYSNTGGYMGLSFAIPIDVAMRVTNQLKAHGYASHGWLGVVIQPLSQELAQSFGMTDASGALIAQVTPMSPAAKAGLKSGDVIRSYDGTAIGASTDLPPLVGDTQVGKTVPITVLRDGQARQFDVTIEALAKSDKQLADKQSASAELGMSVSELSEAQRNDAGVGAHGVLVTAVENGPVAAIGIRPGDILLQLDHKDIDSVEVLISTLKSLPKGKPVAVLIHRDRASLFKALILPRE
jgi:serine protease Do